ncbi:hypothetical protein [Mycolicibacterium sp.]|uniref:hypothetical protein n=1 Tax=Mycolicibacterium sp. TaxID=2320850 RepID=UPI001A2DF5F6|nr:hypothetical protein [Mycolicibacterium sp.]MBJ7339904.1 hypothetical protein [Mycolicibacterium sp.]
MPSRSSQAASSRRRVSPLQPAGAGHYSIHAGTARTPGATSAPARGDRRPTYHADVAQSRLFQTILMDELDELGDLLAKAERRLRRRREEESVDPADVPRALLQLRERMKEAHRLLDALLERFPPD